MDDKNYELVEKFGYKLIKKVPKKDYNIVFTDKGFFILKKVKYKVSEILFVHGAKEHLINKGYKNVDRYITINNIPYIEHDGDCYVMTRLIEGRGCNFKNPLEMQKASKALAEIHEASKNYIPIVKEGHRSNIGKLQKDYLDKCQDFIYIKSLIKMRTTKYKIDLMVVDNIEMLYDMAIESVRNLQKNGYFEYCEEEGIYRYLCHSAYNHNNILVDLKGNLSVINFDHCKYELRCFDIAGFIMGAMDGLDWNFQKAVDILKAYNSVRKVEEREYKLMFSFLQFPQDIWEIATKYYYEDYENFRHMYYIDLKNRIEKLPQRIEFLKKYSSKFT
ncbi:CotS family spore coat protein [Wukongibacter baidiensis]|uniref:CotS family spore coat protein n=1 Tax=Wukongibacter baidiensis TaxID=1723361 RepID=UPI003D7F9B57